VKHKVKLLKVEGDFFDCLVDGERCRYMIQKPQPLSSADANMLRSAMDTRLLAAMTSSMLTSVGLWQRLLIWFRGLGGQVLTQIVGSDGQVFSEFVALGNVTSSFGERVANYIEKVGVEANLDKHTKGLIILRTDVAKIKEGKI